MLFEYRVLSECSHVHLQQIINRAAEQRWRVSHMAYSDGQYVAILEREKTTEK